MALLTQTSIGPRVSSIWVAASSTAPASATSVGMPRARTPAPSISRQAASSRSCPRARMATWAPRWANVRAAARPAPAEPPAMTTTFLSVTILPQDSAAGPLDRAGDVPFPTGVQPANQHPATLLPGRLLGHDLEVLELGLLQGNPEVVGE